MIIWGTRGREKVTSSGQFFCPNCNQNRPYQYKQVGKYFTIYFIPLFQLEKLGDLVECQTCHKKYKPEVLNYKPPTEAERFMAALKAELNSGTPLHMARQKLVSSGMDGEKAQQVVLMAAGANPKTCPTCNFIYANTVVTCSNCGTRLQANQLST